jgi:[protein-PII] uridylyltransferase
MDLQRPPIFRIPLGEQEFPALDWIKTASDCRQYIQDGFAVLRRLHNQGGSGVQITLLMTSLIDRLLQRIFNIAHDKFSPDDRDFPFALVATGGYGREELHPASDVDLLFLVGKKPPAAIISATEETIGLLWDCGLKLGHAVRDIEQSLQQCRKDVTVLTSLLDMRLLCGSPAIYEELREAISALVSGDGGNRFIKNKLKEQQKRHDKYGASVYLLEPNIKESKGGLRDLQTALWVAKVAYRVKRLDELHLRGVIEKNELKILGSAREFIFRVRNELHFKSGGRGQPELMTLALQSELADFFGYEDKGPFLAVERFMAAYYSHVRQIRFISSYIIDRSLQKTGLVETPRIKLSAEDREFGIEEKNGRLDFKDATKPAALDMLRIFLLAQKYKATVGHEAKLCMVKNLSLFDDKVIRSEDAAKLFLGLFDNENNLYEIMRAMNETGVLRSYIPEFADIFCRVQFDSYHVYTVDTHLILALKMLHDLRHKVCLTDYPELCQIAAEIKEPTTLYLAVLLHDIGKGQGKNHSQKGAAMTGEILKRLGLDPDRTAKIQTLVRRHLLMSELSQKRDISDPRLIVEFAETVGDLENLNMLYILTAVDLLAVNPRIWNNWRASLLSELYHRTVDFFLAPHEQFEQGMTERMRQVTEILSEQVGTEEAELLVSGISLRFFRHRSVEQASHELLQISESDHFRFHYRNLEHEASCEIAIYTHGLTYRFNKVAGILAANRVNILWAEIYSLPDGRALDVFRVTSLVTPPFPEERTMSRIQSELKQAFYDQLDVGKLVEQKLKPGLLDRYGKSQPTTVPTKVKIDNQTSDNFTIVDVVTSDRPGLLYDITRVLFRARYKTEFTLISTNADRVEDSFYIRTESGEKIMNPEDLRRLRESILREIKKRNRKLEDMQP